MNEEVLNFDDSVKTVQVTIGKNKYTLCEAMGDAAVQYREAMLRSTKLNDEGKPSGFHGMAEIEPLLVSLCLYQGEELPLLADGTTPDHRSRVPISRIKRWPSRVYRGLYKRIREMSDLVEAEDTEDELVKQAAKITEKLERLRKGREGNSPVPSAPETDGTE